MCEFYFARVSVLNNFLKTNMDMQINYQCMNVWRQHQYFCMLFSPINTPTKFENIFMHPSPLVDISQ